MIRDIVGGFSVYGRHYPEFHRLRPNMNLIEVNYAGLCLGYGAVLYNKVPTLPGTQTLMRFVVSGYHYTLGEHRLSTLNHDVLIYPQNDEDDIIAQDACGLTIRDARVENGWVATQEFLRKDGRVYKNPVGRIPIQITRNGYWFDRDHKVYYRNAPFEYTQAIHRIFGAWNWLLIERPDNQTDVFYKNVRLLTTFDTVDIVDARSVNMEQRGQVTAQELLMEQYGVTELQPNVEFGILAEFAMDYSIEGLFRATQEILKIGDLD